MKLNKLNDLNKRMFELNQLKHTFFNQTKTQKTEKKEFKNRKTQLSNYKHKIHSNNNRLINFLFFERFFYCFKFPILNSFF